MMQPQEQVDGADAVIRAHQLEFLVFGQIAQMDGSEFSERDVNADGHRVLRIVRSGLEARAIGVGSTGTRQCRFDSLAARRYHLHLKAGDGNSVAWFGDRMLGVRVEPGIGIRQEFIHGGRWLDIGSVVDEMPDRDPLCEFR
jgi:hypothetical protein